MVVFFIILIDCWLICGIVGLFWFFLFLSFYLEVVVFSDIGVECKCGCLGDRLVVEDYCVEVGVDCLVDFGVYLVVVR